MKVSLVEAHVPGSDEVRVEAGETVPGRTNCNIGEVNFPDGPRLNSCGDGTAGPAREGLVDQNPNKCETRDDDEDPEESDYVSGCGYITQTVNRGRFEEFLYTLHGSEVFN